MVTIITKDARSMWRAWRSSRRARTPKCTCATWTALPCHVDGAVHNKSGDRRRAQRQHLALLGVELHALRRLVVVVVAPLYRRTMIH